MPCRCDYFEVTAADVRAELGEKLKHSEGQLCNARSLIHKLMKLVPAATMPPELAARAKEHVALLVQHKREEHEQEKAALEQTLASIKGRVQHQKDLIKTTTRLKERELREAEEQEKKLSAALAKLKSPSDDELLG
jgi:hypothetical protein